MKYNINITENCKLFANNYDVESINQIREMSLQNKDSKVRIMPDYHGGKGCVIGTTMLLQGKVNPSHTGVDIGCGVSVYQLDVKNINLEQLDNIIRINIPHGTNVNSKNKHTLDNTFEKELKEMLSRLNISEDRVFSSVGTLGGGNHYIEVGSDSEGILYLTIHSGSRNLGVQVAKYYQNLAYKSYENKVKFEKEEIIKNILDKSKIQEKLANFKTSYPNYYIEYLFGEDLTNYIKDVITTTKYAEINRICMIKTILNNLGLSFDRNMFFQSIHNYIDSNNVLRKGAISAKLGEKVVIPINMRDGMIIGIGLGNEDWNQSAPHGAGRLYSRSKAKEEFTLDEFKETMNGVYTTCVNTNTLDESPMAYKSLDDILECIHETVEVVEVIKPIYNFKSN
ncbi:MAG: RtcB family protein [Cetobacterium sp.]